MTNEAGLLQLETKIDYIWFTLADLYSHSDANTSGAMSVSNFPAQLESWRSWGTEAAPIKNQRDSFSVIAGCVFLVGSLLTIAGKYLDAPRT